MRKQELVHLHALAVEIRDYVSDRESVPPDAFAEYDRNGSKPTSLHRRKTTHKECLLLLLDGILAAIGRQLTENAI
ncbi:UPF0058 family protein [Natrialbaceae archaeon A-arb3/5]